MQQTHEQDLLVAVRIQRALETLGVRRLDDRQTRTGAYYASRHYAERELLLSQLIVLSAQHRNVALSLFEEFALQTIEVNLGLRSKALWPGVNSVTGGLA